MGLAVYPGSFDPITNGHISILRGGLVAFEKVIVAILRNESKTALFSVEERMAMTRAAIDEQLGDDASRVEVHCFDGLLVNYCKERNVHVVLRGLRAVADFEYELQMANMNRHLDSDIETVFIMAKDAYFYVSSRLVKEACRLGGDIDKLVPDHVAKKLSEKLSV